MTILDQLAEHARQRVAVARTISPMEDIRREALLLPNGDFPFERALSGDDLAFICECKRASPSKGMIAPDFPYMDIARSYEDAGAEAVSVLTEPKWFMGSDEYLRQIAESVSIPCLRKDFMVDAYMLYEAKLLGASAAAIILQLVGIVMFTESVWFFQLFLIVSLLSFTAGIVYEAVRRRNRTALAMLVPMVILLTASLLELHF